MGQVLEFVGLHALEKANHHEGSLALPNVPVQLLAILTVVTNEIQEVVLNLKCCAKEETEAREAIEIRAIARRDQRTDSDRIDRRVPSGLFQDHP